MSDEFNLQGTDDSFWDDMDLDAIRAMLDEDMGQPSAQSSSRQHNDFGKAADLNFHPDFTSVQEAPGNTPRPAAPQGNNPRPAASQWNDPRSMAPQWNAPGAAAPQRNGPRPAAPQWNQPRPVSPEWNQNGPAGPNMRQQEVEPVRKKSSKGAVITLSVIILLEVLGIVGVLASWYLWMH